MYFALSWAELIISGGTYVGEDRVVTDVRRVDALERYTGILWPVRESAVAAHTNSL